MSTILQCANDVIGALNRNSGQGKEIPMNMPASNTKAINFI